MDMDGTRIAIHDEHTYHSWPSFPSSPEQIYLQNSRGRKLWQHFSQKDMGPEVFRRLQARPASQNRKEDGSAIRVKSLQMKQVNNMLI